MQNTGVRWDEIEARLRSFYQEWAQNRLRLARLYPRSGSAGDEGWAQRASTLVEATGSPRQFADAWSESLSATDSSARCQYFCDLLGSGYTVETLIELVTRKVEQELSLAEEVADRAEYALRTRADRQTYRSKKYINYLYERWLSTGDFLGEYEKQLATFGIPMRLEPMIEASLYAIYVACSPRSRVVVPRTRMELVRGLAIESRMLHIVKPREFEELLLHVYEALGFRAQVTNATRDWGADLLAWQPGPFGTETLARISHAG